MSKSNQIECHRQDRQTAEIVATITAFVFAAIFATLRLGLPSGISPLPTLGLSLLLIHLPALMELVPNSYSKWYLSREILLLLTISALVFIGIHTPERESSIKNIVPIFGYILFLIQCLRWLKGKHISLFPLFAILTLAAWAAAVTWGGNYSSPVFFEKLALGLAGRDTLLYSAIGNMFQIHGIPSTGLDGVPYFPYHFGSVIIISSLGKLLGISTLDFYNVGYPIVFVPALFYSLLLIVSTLRRTFFTEESPAPLMGNRWFWITLILIPLCVLSNYSSILNLFASESYNFSLSLSFILGSIMLMCSLEPKTRSSKIVFLIIFPLLATVLGLIKVSGLYIFIAAALPFFLTKKSWPFRIGFILTCILALGVLKIASSPETRVAGLFPLHDALAWERPAEYFLLPFWLSWAYIFTRLFTSNVKHLVDVKTAILQDRLPDLLVVISVCIFGALPGLLFSISSSSYFIYPQFMLAFALLLAYVPTLDLGTKTAHAFPINRNTTVTTLLGILLSLFVITQTASNAFKPFERVVMQNLATRILLKDSVKTGQIEIERIPTQLIELRRILAHHPLKNTLKQALTGTPGKAEELFEALSITNDDINSTNRGRAVSTLREIHESSEAEKKRTLLHIPKAFSSFWEIAPPCMIAPLAGPAITGFAMIDALPTEDCTQINFNYGYFNYDMIAQDRGLDKQAADLCSKAKTLGFEEVLTLTEIGEEITTTKLCN
ncbi:MAG: hypothetical protein OCC46_10165 [Pseudodesulfovibrio sp.]